MEFSPPLPSSAFRGWRWVAAILAAAALVFYGCLLTRHVAADAGGSDSSGYLNHARLLGMGHVHVQARTLPGLPAAAAPSFLYVPLGLKPAPNNVGLVPTYPTGLPLLILAAAKLVGWKHAANLVMVLHGLAGVLLTFALGRSLRLGAGWCALAAIILAASPLYLNYSLQAMSDLPALVWATAAGVAAWRARDPGSGSAGETRAEGRSGSPGAWALAAGASLSVAVLIRPNNTLMLAPILIAWFPTGRAQACGLWRRGLLFILGGLPGAAFFFLHSLRAYGNVFVTGYGDPISMFESEVVGVTLRHYAQWLPVLFTPGVWLVLLLPLAAWRAPRAAAFLAAWALVYLGFYVSYHHTHETWWYLRFLLPAAPALLIGAAWAASGVLGLLARGRAWPRPLAVAAFGLALIFGLREELTWDRNFQVLHAGEGEETYRLAAQWLQAHVPANAAMLAMQTSGALFYYTDFPIIRWDELDPTSSKKVEAAAAAARVPIFAPLYGFETDDALKSRMPGRWKVVGHVRDITIWQRTGEQAAP